MNAIATVYRRELTRIFAVRPAFAVLVAALFAYAALYPQPYLTEALRDVPIAVVDRDGSTSSRELVRRIDATEAVVVAQVLPDMVTAERAIYARLLNGIVLVPTDFERDLLHGRPSPVALYSDDSYFLMNSRVSGNVAAAVRDFGTEVEAARMVRFGVDPTVAAAAADPLPLTAVTLFNPQAGYATYVLPAAFVLILQVAKPCAIAESGQCTRRGFQRQPRPSHTAGTSQRDEPRLADRVQDQSQLTASTDRCASRFLGNGDSSLRGGKSAMSPSPST
jgi:ABC-2 type transport system permease protein